MTNHALTWQQSAVLAAALLVLALVLYLSASRASMRAYPFVREAGILSALYSLWQLAGTLSVISTTDAFTRARAIVRVERDLHLPSEASVQRSVLHHPLVIQASNYYYAVMHFGVLAVFLVWLFVRHRDKYRSVRMTLVLVTFVCLAIQLVPVAPPRLLPGYVDTAAQYGQSVYSLGLGADQLSAMPSVHVAWAVLIAWSVVRLSDSRWRWLVIAHAAITVWVVVATANHFWLDGVGAVVVLAACAGAQRATSRLVGRRFARAAEGSTDRQAVAARS